METINKFSRLDTFSMNLGNLAGLASETLQEVEPYLKHLGSVGEDTYTKLDADLTSMKSEMDRPSASLLTPAINEANRKCDAILNEIKRMVKAGTLSTIPDRAEAGRQLMYLLEGFRNLNREPLITQITMTNELLRRYNASPELINAAGVLGLAEIFKTLTEENSRLDTLYHDRLEKQAQTAPAATDRRSAVADGYTSLCSIVLKAANLHPETKELQTLFHVLDGLRKKYATLSPAKIDIRHAEVDPIPSQAYTGKHVTPIPTARYNGEDLIFPKDFTVTYRNNVKASASAVVTLRGRGRFTGQHERTFTIELKQ
ncbi:MAG: DUF6261 family protein [Tannerella sp.]|jgi:uncharacterized protein YhaN|nr:DUF6261 family protein [Tannerella sp.]